MSVLPKKFPFLFTFDFPTYESVIGRKHKDICMTNNPSSTIWAFITGEYFENVICVLLSIVSFSAMTNWKAKNWSWRCQFIKQLVHTSSVWTNCVITFLTRWKIFFSERICLLTSWACTIGIWSTLAQLNLVRQFSSYVTWIIESPTVSEKLKHEYLVINANSP